VILKGTFWSWMVIQGKEKRIVGVSSTSSGVKVDADEEETLKWLDYQVYSWTVEEYLDAVRMTITSIQDVLDTEISLDQNLKEKKGLSFSSTHTSLEIKQNLKHYFAGGSSVLCFRM